MPDISVKIPNLTKLINDYQKKGKDISAAIELGVKRVAMMYRDSATQFTQAGHPDHPNVDTGRLAGSIKFKPESQTGKVSVYRVGSDVDYAAFVEFGHAQTPGRFVPALGKRLVADHVRPFPFMRSAISDIFDSGKAQRVYENTIKEALSAY